MTYAPNAPRGSLSRPPGTWHTGADQRPGADLRLLGERGTKIMKWALPLGLGLIYGFWAATDVRRGGPITGWNVFFGFATALVFMLALMALRALAPRLPHVPRALAWAAFAGMALGFLVSTTNQSVLRSVVLGLALAVGVFVSVLYRVSTHRTPGAVAPGELHHPATAGEDAMRTAAYASESSTTRSALGTAGAPTTTTATTTASTTGTAPTTATAPGAVPPHPIRLRRQRRGKARLLMRTLKMARAMRRRH
ncbi:hypothetical protein [Streptomyces sp. NPDC005012]|uniref:hypothetical protein n=1 Tax=Streptomyces sp. NPDC005012 TaxID=3154558 RepID=UPI0033B4C324